MQDWQLLFLDILKFMILDSDNDFLGFFGIFQIVVSFVDLECSPNLEILWPGRLLGTFRNLIFWDNSMFLAPADEQLGWSFRILPREFVTPLYPIHLHPRPPNITQYHTISPTSCSIRMDGTLFAVKVEKPRLEFLFCRGFKRIDYNRGIPFRTGFMLKKNCFSQPKKLQI